MAKLKTLQNPWADGLGNDYVQDLTYVQEVDEKTGKSTWRDGIYTKLSQDVKDPEGYNKRTVMVKQAEWGDAADIETIKPGQGATLSGETDGSGLFTSGYATGNTFGYPFGETADTYYTDNVADDLPTGIDVASFRKVDKTLNTEDHE